MGKKINGSLERDLKYILYIFIILSFSACSYSNLPKEEILSKEILTLEHVFSIEKNKLIGNNLLFRPDSKELISTWDDRNLQPLYVWDLEKKKLKKQIDKNKLRISKGSKFLFTEDSKRLFFSLQFNNKREFDKFFEKRIHRITRRFGEINTTTYDNPKFYKYNDYKAEEIEEFKTVFGYQEKVNQVIKTSAASDIFVFDGDYLITDSYSERYSKTRNSKGLVYFNRNDFTQYEVRLKGIEPSGDRVLSPDKKHLTATKYKSSRTKEKRHTYGIGVYSIKKGGLLHTIEDIYTNVSINDMKFLDNENVIVGPTSKGKIGYRALDGNFYNTTIGDLPIKEINIHTKKNKEYFEKNYMSVMFAPSFSQRHFISYSRNSFILLVWDRKTQKPVQRITFDKFATAGMAINQQKTHFALSHRNKIYLYKINLDGQLND